MPSAPNFSQSAATASTSGTLPPRALRSVAILFMFMLSLVMICNYDYNFVVHLHCWRRKITENLHRISTKYIYMVKRRLLIALFGNTHQTKKSHYASLVVQLFKEKGAEIFVEQDFYKCAESKIGRFDDSHIFSMLDFDADLAVSLGGDGTFLRAARFVRNRGIPILGINIGHLGFMAEVNPEDIQGMINDICEENYVVERRSVIEADLSGGSLGIYPFALNEVAVLKQDISSMIKIRVTVDGEYMTTYSADGLIVATPTGSTGYALSAGGPVVVPQSRSFVIAAVAPHSLNVRPIVLCDNIEVKLEVQSRSHSYLVSIDGRSIRCDENNVLTLRRAPYDISIVRNKNKTFYDTLREKLMWDGDMQK